MQVQIRMMRSKPTLIQRGRSFALVSRAEGRVARTAHPVAQHLV